MQSTSTKTTSLLPNTSLALTKLTASTGSPKFYIYDRILCELLHFDKTFSNLKLSLWETLLRACEHFKSNTWFNHTRRGSYHCARISAEILQGNYPAQTLNLRNPISPLIIRLSILVCNNEIQKYSSLMPEVQNACSSIHAPGPTFNSQVEFWWKAQACCMACAEALCILLYRTL